jgi:SAM-dependent methyltransferase
VLDLTTLALPDGLARLRPLLPDPPARVLEVGCGRGALAAELGRLGWQVTGVEPDEEAAALAAKRGVDVLPVPLAEVAATGFDVVLFTRSLHHLPDLDTTLADAAGRLRAGGVVVLEEFARERVDGAAAAFLYDAVAVLGAAGMADDDESAHPHHAAHAGHAEHPGHPDEADPLRRWQRDRGELSDEPLHTGAAMLAGLATLGPPGEVDRHESLWRIVTSRLTGPDEEVAARVAGELRRIERRRIADGSLPAIGFVTSARVTD